MAGELVEARFRVMGSDAHVAVEGDDAASCVEMAVARLERLERTWSRFLVDSEVSRANTAAGRWVPISDETVALVDRAQRAAVATGGRFDPTRLHDVIAAGYAGSFGPDGPAPAPPAELPAGPPVPVDGVELDRAGRRLRVRPGTGFDPGGIAKGFAADLVVVLLLDAGAAGACVNLGGDLRLGGRVDGDWVVDVEDPRRRAAGPIRRLSVAAGAVATSSRCRRRWRRSDGTFAHHLIDPRTGRPAETDVLTATVVAAEGWVAEALATALLVAGSRATDVAALVAGAGATGLLVTTSGVVELAGLDPFLPAPRPAGERTVPV